MLCKDSSKTNIAFLGTALLAKSLDSRADLFAIKPEHAKGNENAFSARTLCHSVLVPLSAELGIDIGVSGREPLNNQPYFRMTRLGDGTPVRPKGRVAFNYLIDLVRELQALPEEGAARSALRAFIAVRRTYLTSYGEDKGDSQISTEKLIAIVKKYVSEDSEGGRRAQAVVAGLMDVVAGKDRVESGRINDPSRRFPGDVCVRAAAGTGVWEKAIEVRDKPVTEADIRIFGATCIGMGVHDAAVVAVSERQTALDRDALSSWANHSSLGLTLFIGWDAFIDQALFWAGDAKLVAASLSVSFIHGRLVAVEVSFEGVARWQALVGSTER